MNRPTKTVLNRSDLIRLGAKRCSLNQTQFAEAIDTFAEVLAEEIAKLKEYEENGRIYTERITWMHWGYWEKKINKPKKVTLNGKMCEGKNTIRHGISDTFKDRLNK